MTKKLYEYNGYWLWQRSDTPIYYIAWHPRGRKGWRRKSTGTQDFELAKQRLVEWVSARAGPLRDQAPENVRVADVLHHYAESVMKGRPSYAQTRSGSRALLAFFAEHDVVFVSDLTLDVQDRYIEWRRDQIRARGHAGSNGTIGRDLDVLSAAVREYWKRGYLLNPPWIRNLPPPAPRDRVLEPDEWRRLLAECHEPHLRLFCQLAVHTLQRPGAIFHLTWKQVDLQQRRIDFLAPGVTQTNKRRPVVPINGTLWRVLSKVGPGAPDGHVVTYKGRPIKNVRKSFAKACERANLSQVTPYVLRHSGATWMAASGVPMRQISGMLGHSQQRTTEQWYAKHRPEFLKDAAGALDRLFGEGGPTARQRAPAHPIGDPPGC